MPAAKGMSVRFWVCPCGFGYRGNLAFYSHLGRHAREMNLGELPPGLSDASEFVKKEMIKRKMP